MLFKNAICYQLEPGFRVTAQDLESVLSTRTLQPCAALSSHTEGWLPPAGDSAMVYSSERHLLIRFGAEDKILPGAVIQRAVDEEARALEQQQGFKPGRKQLRDIRDRVRDRLLPVALCRRTSFLIWLDLNQSLVIVDTPSLKRAEGALTCLRATLGSLPAIPSDTVEGPRARMTDWLRVGQAPGQLELGEKCALKNAGGARISYMHTSVKLPEIVAQIAAGYAVDKLELEWMQRVRFEMDAAGVVRKIKAVDMAPEEDAGAGQGDRDAFDAEFALTTGEISALLRVVFDSLGGLRPLLPAKAA